MALAVQPDEAFNPVDVGVPGPDAFVRQILSRAGLDVDGNRGVSPQCFGEF